MNSKKYKPVNVDKDFLERFEYLYSGRDIKKIFLNRCLFLAVNDKDFFQKVYYNPIFIEVK